MAVKGAPGSYHKIDLTLMSNFLKILEVCINGTKSDYLIIDQV